MSEELLISISHDINYLSNQTLNTNLPMYLKTLFDCLKIPKLKLPALTVLRKVKEKVTSEPALCIPLSFLCELAVSDNNPLLGTFSELFMQISFTRVNDDEYMKALVVVLTHISPSLTPSLQTVCINLLCGCLSRINISDNIIHEISLIHSSSLSILLLLSRYLLIYPSFSTIMTTTYDSIQTNFPYTQLHGLFKYILTKEQYIQLRVSLSQLFILFQQTDTICLYCILHFCEEPLKTIGDKYINQFILEGSSLDLNSNLNSSSNSNLNSSSNSNISSSNSNISSSNSNISSSNSNISSSLSLHQSLIHSLIKECVYNSSSSPSPSPIFPSLPSLPLPLSVRSYILSLLVSKHIYSEDIPVLVPLCHDIITNHYQDIHILHNGLNLLYDIIQHDMYSIIQPIASTIYSDLFPLLLSIRKQRDLYMYSTTILSPYQSILENNHENNSISKNLSTTLLFDLQSKECLIANDNIILFNEIHICILHLLYEIYRRCSKDIYFIPTHFLILFTELHNEEIYMNNSIEKWKRSKYENIRGNLYQTICSMSHIYEYCNEQLKTILNSMLFTYATLSKSIYIHKCILYWCQNSIPVTSPLSLYLYIYYSGSSWKEIKEEAIKSLYKTPLSSFPRLSDYFLYLYQEENEDKNNYICSLICSSSIYNEDLSIYIDFFSQSTLISYYIDNIQTSLLPFDIYSKTRYMYYTESSYSTLILYIWKLFRYTYIDNKIDINIENKERDQIAYYMVSLYVYILSHFSSSSVLYKSTYIYIYQLISLYHSFLYFSLYNVSQYNHKYGDIYKYLYKDIPINLKNLNIQPIEDDDLYSEDSNSSSSSEKYEIVLENSLNSLGELNESIINHVTPLQSVFQDPSNYIYKPEIYKNLESYIYTEKESEQKTYAYNIIKYSYYYMTNDFYITTLSTYISKLQSLYTPTTSSLLNDIDIYIYTLSLYVYMLTPFVNQCYLLLAYTYIQQLLSSASIKYISIAISLLKHLLYICHFNYPKLPLYVYAYIKDLLVEIQDRSKSRFSRGDMNQLVPVVLGILPYISVAARNIDDLGKWNETQIVSLSEYIFQDIYTYIELYLNSLNKEFVNISTTIYGQLFYIRKINISDNLYYLFTSFFSPSSSTSLSLCGLYILKEILLIENRKVYIEEEKKKKEQDIDIYKETYAQETIVDRYDWLDGRIDDKPLTSASECLITLYKYGSPTAKVICIADLVVLFNKNTSIEGTDAISQFLSSILYPLTISNTYTYIYNLCQQMQLHNLFFLFLESYIYINNNDTKNDTNLEEKMIYIFDHLIDTGYSLPSLPLSSSLYIYINRFSINKYISICTNRLWNNIIKSNKSLIIDIYPSLLPLLYKYATSNNTNNLNIFFLTVQDLFTYPSLYSRLNLEIPHLLETVLQSFQEIFFDNIQLQKKTLDRVQSYIINSITRHSTTPSQDISIDEDGGIKSRDEELDSLTLNSTIDYTQVFQLYSHYIDIVPDPSLVTEYMNNEFKESISPYVYICIELLYKQIKKEDNKKLNYMTVYILFYNLMFFILFYF
ncbi:hypothetical protein WA158_005035 [Blastocystis sp. Blastoise]